MLAGADGQYGSAPVHSSEGTSDRIALHAYARDDGKYREFEDGPINSSPFTTMFDSYVFPCVSL